MNWCEFTRNNANKFNNSIIDDNCLLYKNIQKDKEKIKKFMIKNKNLKMKVNKIEHFDDEIDNLMDSPWVYKKGINQNIKFLDTSYEIEWSNGIIKIRCNNKELTNIIKRIKIMILLLEYLRSLVNDYPKLTIYLVLTDLKKTFPENGIMKPENANTGYVNFRTNIIFIWRLEEFEKVLIHESIHFFDLDGLKRDHTDRIDIKGEHRYYEGFTDFWAIYYYIIYISIISKVNIKQILELEFNFVKNQALTLNSLLGLNSWKTKPNKVIKQSTAGFSYYIIKYLLFLHSLDNNITNDISTLDTVLSKGFIQEEYIDVNSARMTLLSL